MPEVVIVATITPAEGKADRVEQLLKTMTETVHAEESEVLRYHCHRQIGAEGTPVFIMLETYKNEESLKSHGASKHMAQLIKDIQAENLLAKPLDIVRCAPVSGFASRL